MRKILTLILCIACSSMIASAKLPDKNFKCAIIKQSTGYDYYVGVMIVDNYLDEYINYPDERTIIEKIKNLIDEERTYSYREKITVALYCEKDKDGIKNYGLYGIGYQAIAKTAVSLDFRRPVYIYTKDGSKETLERP
ncbi:MAG: hypothetical protein PHD21_03330 [Flavobacteriales bacterium]|nr:hypothetical protein [Flavobacteriales bacterium]